jgi:tripartite-type tricarboxylate transporter receptor subunit TctC
MEPIMHPVRKSTCPRVLPLAVVLAVYMAVPHLAVAQSYPSRPVRVIVPFAPGGPNDLFARIVSAGLSQRFGQQFYVENIAGASGNIGTAQAAKAASDGHTLLIAASAFVITPSLFASVPYDPVKDFEPVTLAVTSPHVITVTPSVPAKSLTELVALIRSSPGKYNFAHGGAGVPAHLLGEKFRLTTGLDIVAVPFNGGGPAVASVIGGHTPIGFSALAPAAALIAGGQLRALAVTSKARSKLLPDVATTEEAGYPDIVGDLWVGVLLPARTPKEIVTTLHREIAAILGKPDTVEKLAAVAFEPVASTPEAFASVIKTELESWRKVIQAAKVKAP